MTYATIITDIADGIMTITLNRPDRLNAFTHEMRVETMDALDTADADDAVRGIIVTGAGRGFCAGADLGSGGNAFNADARSDRPGGLPPGARARFEGRSRVIPRKKVPPIPRQGEYRHARILSMVGASGVFLTGIQVARVVVARGNPTVPTTSKRFYATLFRVQAPGRGVPGPGPNVMLICGGSRS